MFATRHLNTDNQKRVKRIVKDEEDTLANIEQEVDMSLIEIAYNGSGIAEGGDYLHNSPSEAQKFNVVQLLISGTSAPTFGNTLLAAAFLHKSK